MILTTIEYILKILFIIIPLLIAIAYFTLAERKIMAAIQRRRGPNVVGYAGLLQPLADGLKLIVKETTIPSNSNKFLFNFAPILTFFLSLLGWAVIPFGDGIVLSDINLGLMFIFAISSLGVYGVIIAGWSSNSKYAFLGALRSAAQMISYELTMGFIIINVVILSGSFNLSDIIYAQTNLWYFIPLLPMFGMFFICALAETNRHPFDLMEAEAELVSGFNVEYSGVGFAMFFLGEYGNILLMCSLLSILFLGGWAAPCSTLMIIPGPIWFGIKIACFVILFIWVRAAFPRYRYDQLMRLGWKVFLPFSFAYLILTISIHVNDFTQNLYYHNGYFQGRYYGFLEDLYKLRIALQEQISLIIDPIQDSVPLDDKCTLRAPDLCEITHISGLALSLLNDPYEVAYYFSKYYSLVDLQGTPHPEAAKYLAKYTCNAASIIHERLIDMKTCATILTEHSQIPYTAALEACKNFQIFKMLFNIDTVPAGTFACYGLPEVTQAVSLKYTAMTRDIFVDVLDHNARIEFVKLAVKNFTYYIVYSPVTYYYGPFFHFTLNIPINLVYHF